MKEVHFVTTNSGKVASLQRTLAEHNITVIQSSIELPEPQTVDLRVIATEKVLAAYRAIGRPVIAQDSGFFLPAWGDFPGPFIKFTLQTMGLEGLIALAEARSGHCEFRECLAYYEPGFDEPKFFEAVIPGKIAEKSRGTLPADAWSELLLIFIPDGYEKTVAEMSQAERDAWRKIRGDGSAARFTEWITTQ